jgi:hypothetical protein
MKILKIFLPLAFIALLSSFVLSSFSKGKQSSRYSKQIKVEEKKPIDPLYAKFLDKFDTPDFPFIIKFDKPGIEKNYEGNQRDKIKESKFLGASFSKMIPEIKDGMMSRMGPDDFVAEIIIKKSDRYDAVIYSRVPSFRSTKTYYVATYNKHGKQISKIQIAQKNYEIIRECQVSEDGKIAIHKTAVRSEYDRNADKTRFSYHKNGIEIYTINEDGEFVSQHQKSDSDGKDFGMK